MAGAGAEYGSSQSWGPDPASGSGLPRHPSTPPHLPIIEYPSGLSMLFRTLALNSHFT